MMKAKLIIAGEERLLTNFHYEYFYPVETKLDYAGGRIPMSLSFDTIATPGLIASSQNSTSSIRDIFFSEDPNMHFRSFDSPTIGGTFDNEWLTNPVAFHEAETFDMLFRPNEGIDGSIRYQLAGGLFNLSFASTEQDEFFLEWLTLGTMKEGRFEIYKGDDDHYMKIEFWDCYCVGFQEAMEQGSRPMEINLRLSPAITRNRNVVEHEKNWKVTDIHGTALSTASSPTAQREATEDAVINKVGFMDSEGNIVEDELDSSETYSIYAETQGTQLGDEVTFELTLKEGVVKLFKGKVGSMGIAKIKNVIFND